MINLDVFNELKSAAETNTRIFTPQKIVREMLSTLPPEVWNSHTTFLDPAVKSGVYLVEIFNRFMETPSLIKEFPDNKERSKHILKNQIFGIAIDNLSCLTAQRNLYGCIGGVSNIRVIEKYMDLVKNKDSKYYIEAVKKEFNEMKFNVVIGNPPYQDEDGGGGINKSSSPIYSDFTMKATYLNPDFISFIIPARWIAGGKLTLDKFRTFMVESKHIKYMYMYNNLKDVFESVDLSGGVLYFGYDCKNTYNEVDFYRCTSENKEKCTKRLDEYTYYDVHGKQQYMILTDKYADSIINKISEKSTMGIAIQYDPFGFLADFDDNIIPFENSVKVVCNNSRETYTDRENVSKSVDKIDKYKVITGKANPDGGGTNNVSNGWNVINVPKIIKPQEVCTITYFVLGATETKEEAENLMSFVKTKFFRYLVMITISGMNMSQRNYRFIPHISDFTHPWTDEMLYAKYNLTEEEITYIESTIKPM